MRVQIVQASDNVKRNGAALVLPLHLAVPAVCEGMPQITTLQVPCQYSACVRLFSREL